MKVEFSVLFYKDIKMMFALGFGDNREQINSTDRVISYKLENTHVKMLKGNELICGIIEDGTILIQFEKQESKIREFWFEFKDKTSIKEFEETLNDN